MGRTLVEKILSEKLGRDVQAGETVVVDVDFAALHDGSGPLLVRLMNERGYNKDPLFDPNRILFTTEFGPTPTKEVANEHALIRNYAKEKGCHWYEGGTGCVHTHVYEDFLGAVRYVWQDSPTVHGAFGAFATGCGSTDMVCSPSGKNVD